MMLVGWSWWEKGWYVIVGHVTGYLVTCCWKDSDKNSGIRSGYSLNFVPYQLFIAPVKAEFSLYTTPLSFGGTFLSFPVSWQSKCCIHGANRQRAGSELLNRSYTRTVTCWYEPTFSVFVPGLWPSWYKNWNNNCQNKCKSKFWRIHLFHNRL